MEQTDEDRIADIEAGWVLSRFSSLSVHRGLEDIYFLLEYIERQRTTIEMLSNQETVKALAASMEDIRAGRHTRLAEIRNKLQ